MKCVIEDMRREEREEGRLEGMQEIVLKMLEDERYSIEELAALSGFSTEEIKKFKLS